MGFVGGSGDPVLCGGVAIGFTGLVWVSAAVEQRLRLLAGVLRDGCAFVYLDPALYAVCFGLNPGVLWLYLKTYRAASAEWRGLQLACPRQSNETGPLYSTKYLELLGGMICAMGRMGGGPAGSSWPPSSWAFRGVALPPPGWAFVSKGWAFVSPSPQRTCRG